MNRPHPEHHPVVRATRERHRYGRGGERPHRACPLTSEGFPASTPDAARPSPVVFVSEESRARHPWLPPRVIAGSVWRGPRHERVRVDRNGDAAPWPCRPAATR